MKETQNHYNQLENSLENQANNLSQIEELQNEVLKKRPALKEWLNEHGHKTLAEYTQTVRENESVPIQPREDIGEAVYNTAAPLVGEKRAQLLAHQIIASPVIITANHHGPDAWNLTRQGVGVIALAFNAGEDVPVTASAIIPQKNTTWPRGLVLSQEQKLLPREGETEGRSIPLRINIYPDSQVERMVSVTPPYTKEMITGASKSRGAIGQVEELKEKGVISEADYSALHNILTNVYLDPDTLNLPTYSDQITRINDGMWRMQHAPEIRDQVPGAVYLELERIVSQLVVKDLQNPDSFVSHAYFSPKLRKRVLENLNGVQGCWDKDKLKILNDLTNPIDNTTRAELMGGAGTMFFAGIDQKGRRIPLSLVGKASGRDVPIEEVDSDTPLFLKGIDKSGKSVQELPFTREALIHALQEKKILPSVLTDFLTLAFARGMKCYGGFNQADYLPNIKAGLVDALKKTGYQQWSEAASTVPAINLNTGLVYAVTPYKDGVKPSGGIDFVRKPLTAQDYAKMQSLTVQESFAFALPGIYSVVTSLDQRNPRLASITEDDIYQTIGDKYVTIESE